MSGLKVYLGKTELTALPSVCTVPATLTGAVSCTYTVTGSEVADANEVRVEARDPAGNIGTSTASVFLDFTRPKLVSSGVSPKRAKPGDTVVYSLNADEKLRVAPSLAVIKKSGGTETLAFAPLLNTSHSYSTTIPANAAAAVGGTYGVTFVLEDEVGNLSHATGTATGEDVVGTVTPPSVGNFAVSPRRLSANSGSNVLTVSFDLTDTDRDSLKVLLDGEDLIAKQPSPCTVPATTGTVTCRRDHPRALHAHGQRPGGPPGRAQGHGGNVLISDNVTFDFVDPRAPRQQRAPRAPRPATDLLYTLSADEALKAAPTLTVKQRSGTGTLTLTPVPDTTYTYEATLPANAASTLTGTYDVTFKLEDSVGNISDSDLDRRADPRRHQRSRAHRLQPQRQAVLGEDGLQLAGGSTSRPRTRTLPS